jgi:hypothetical protein
MPFQSARQADASFGNFFALNVLNYPAISQIGHSIGNARRSSTRSEYGSIQVTLTLFVISPGVATSLSATSWHSFCIIHLVANIDRLLSDCSQILYRPLSIGECDLKGGPRDLGEKGRIKKLTIVQIRQSDKTIVASRKI